ncbi:hypothetical protein DE146DRAFT_735122 [Phaeosphaeria sp. MPI-PUGE-AT-0046c]|nr:hypothetical protein DE146DRAFT_735122 [Phaeosphaeria sp. MPI-PUGE-AT-0046c]
MSSAVSRVFSTPELRELILLQLPLPSLLLSRRISPHFNTLITTSPILQHALFLRSNPTPSSKNWTVNPLLRKHFLPFFAAPDGRFSSRDYSLLTLLDWTTHPASRAAFLRKEASWRRMALISHSPSTLKIKRWVHGQGGSSEDVACVPFDSSCNGVTMGVVWDVTQSFLVNNIVASFGLAFEEKGDGGVGMTLYLSMTVQCCIYTDDEDEQVRLRSEGEELTAHKVEWETARGEDKGDMWSGGATDLTGERGGVEEPEYKAWKDARTGVSSGDALDA